MIDKLHLAWKRVHKAKLQWKHSFMVPWIQRLVTRHILSGDLQAMPKPIMGDTGVPMRHEASIPEQLLHLSNVSLVPSHLTSHGGWRDRREGAGGEQPKSGLLRALLWRLLPLQRNAWQPKWDAVCFWTIWLNWCQVLHVQATWVWISS